MNRLIKKLIIITGLIILLLLVGSCSGSRELDTLAIVITVGLDFEDGEVVVTNEITSPITGTGESGSLSQEDSIFVQGRGATIIEALENTMTHFNRIPYFPHNQLIIFGEEFAKRGIGDYIDMLSRDNEQRELGLMLVAKGAKAYDVMGIKGGVSNVAGVYLFEMLNKESYNSKTRTLTVDEFFKYYYEPGEGITLGVVQIIQKPQIDKEKSGTTIDVLSIVGGAVFRKDTLAIYFTGDEMKGFNFIINELKPVSIVFESPDYLIDNKEIIGRRGRYSEVRVFKNKTKMEINLIQGKPYLSIDVEFRGILRESTEGLDISEPGVLEEMEDACAKQVEEYIRMAMEKGQEFSIDTFGIGSLFHRKYPELWKEMKKDWSSIFSTLDYTVNVNAHINAVGFTNAPPNLMKGE